jgi:hypothetical protein
VHAARDVLLFISGLPASMACVKREADSLTAALCPNQPARSPAKNKVCSPPLNFLCYFNAKPDTAQSFCSHEYVNSLYTFIDDALVSVRKLNPPPPALNILRIGLTSVPDIGLVCVSFLGHFPIFKKRNGVGL